MRSKKSFKSCSTALRKLRQQLLVGAIILRFSDADAAKETDVINVYLTSSAAIVNATPERALRINGPHSTKGLRRESLEQKWLRIMKSKEYGKQIDNNDLIVQASLVSGNLGKLHL